MFTQSYLNINTILAQYSVIPKIISHPPVFTCEEADRYTPNPECGIKTLLLKTASGKYIACVITGRDRLDLDVIKMIVNTKKLSFIPPELAYLISGSEQGSIPPFGHRETVAIIMDTYLKDLREIYFNPGINTETYGLSGVDFQKIMKAKGTLLENISKK